MRFVESLADLVSPNGVIGVMSSGLGSIADNKSGGWEVYRTSKAALAMMMRSFAAQHVGDGKGFVIAPDGCGPTWAAPMRLSSGRQPVIHERAFHKPLPYAAVGGISTCEDNAANDGNAQIADTPRRLGERVKSTCLQTLLVGAKIKKSGRRV